MRLVLAGVGLVAALVFMAASAGMNWVFLKSLGKSELEGQIFGAFSVALDVTKSLLPVFIGWAVIAKKRVYAVLASGIFTLLFLFSLGSAIGFTALNRGAVVGGKDVIAARFAVASRDIGKVEAELAGLSHARPQSAIAEALRGLEQDRKWSTSKGCTEATASDSRTFCEGYFSAKSELATATERLRLDARLTALRSEIAALQEAGAGQDNDPQASMLARLTGVGVTTAQTVLIASVAVLVEVLAAFGLYLAIGWLPERVKPAQPMPIKEADTPQPDFAAPEVVTAPKPMRVARAATQKALPVPRGGLEDAEYWSAPVRRLQLSDQN